MTGHEIEHYDQPLDVEALPYGAREFAQELGHQAVSGGDIIIEGPAVTPASILQEEMKVPLEREPFERTFSYPKKVTFLGRQSGLKPGVVL